MSANKYDIATKAAEIVKSLTSSQNHAARIAVREIERRLGKQSKLQAALLIILEDGYKRGFNVDDMESAYKMLRDHIEENKD